MPIELISIIIRFSLRQECDVYSFDTLLQQRGSDGWNLQLRRTSQVFFHPSEPRIDCSLAVYKHLPPIEVITWKMFRMLQNIWNEALHTTLSFGYEKRSETLAHFRRFCLISCGFVDRVFWAETIHEFTETRNKTSEAS